MTLQARAVDHCGRATDPATAQTFQIDQTPPEISWAVPGVIATPTARLTGTTLDPAPLGSLVQRV